MSIVLCKRALFSLITICFTNFLAVMREKLAALRKLLPAMLELLGVMCELGWLCSRFLLGGAS
ncbi:hypothetical protein AFK71_14190 [Virgibacillus pantothenticus]|uniref:Uncharacterized protein n=1 Tax=Virgibacillus pantothenticus TaxID=1473 RepID=A0A0L0QM29_VIRPA|nr:hypothetical protein AFK71_14190 [Virgibacillus pantothenticus]